MIKIKTALIGSFGNELSLEQGIIKFDHTGTAEVTEEIAEHLTSNFPDVYYVEEEEKPTPKSGKHIRPEDDPNVLEFARNHTAGKNAEAAGAPPLVVESTTKETSTQSQTLVDEFGKTIPTELVKEKEEELIEESKEEDLDIETVDMLKKLSLKDIHATLVSAGVQDEETAKIKDKDILIPIAAKKLT